MAKPISPAPKRLVVVTTDGKPHTFPEGFIPNVEEGWLVVYEKDRGGRSGIPVAGWTDRACSRFYLEDVPRVPDYGTGEE